MYAGFILNKTANNIRVNISINFFIFLFSFRYNSKFFINAFIICPFSSSCFKLFFTVNKSNSLIFANFKIHSFIFASSTISSDIFSMYFFFICHVLSHFQFIAFTVYPEGQGHEADMPLLIIIAS